MEKLNLYRKLFDALRLDHEHQAIRDAVTDLSLAPSIAEQLIMDLDFRSRTIEKLHTHICRLLEWQDQPGQVPIRIYHDIYRDTFDKGAFTARMFTYDFNLQDLALLSSYGGVHFLEAIFHLPLTNNREMFFFNYNHRYYTRHCGETQSVWFCAQKAGYYRDHEMIEENYVGLDLIDVLVGAIRAGHQDIVETYMPILMQAIDPHTYPDLLEVIIPETIIHNRLDICKYLFSLNTILLDRDFCRKCFLLTAQEGRPEFFDYFLPQAGLTSKSASRLTKRAVLGGHKTIVLYLQQIERFDIYTAVRAAVRAGDVATVHTYLNVLTAAQKRDLGSAYDGAGNVEVCQKLYDAGIRPECGTIYNFISHPKPNLDVLKFNLDHFGIVGALEVITEKAIISENREVVAMILDHPSMIAHGVGRAMWRSLTHTQYLNVYCSVTVADFLPVVSQMLVERGFQPEENIT